MLRTFCVAALMVCEIAAGQAPLKERTNAAPAAGAATLSFDVASIRPSLDFSSPIMQAAMRAGNYPKWGAHVEGLRAEYNRMQLRDLIANAYEVKTYQVDMPDALNSQSFDIVARMPEGSTVTDAPKMLRTLLEDRFKLEAKSKTEERPVLALIVGKSGPKMKSSPAPPPLDDKAELKPGERRIDTPNGPAIMTTKPSRPGSGFGSTMNMGTKGIMTYSGSFDQQGYTMHMDFTGVTMAGLSTMLNQMMVSSPGSGGNAKPVVDMTGLTGNYAAAVEFSQQFNMGNGGNSGVPNGVGVASDPGGNGQSGIYNSVQKMGLKLEQRKAPLEQVTVTHAEKVPTEN